MNVRIDVYMHLPPEMSSGITQALNALNLKVDQVMTTLDDVVAKVAALTAIDDSVVALLTDLKTKLDAAGTDPVKLQALSDALSAQTQRLADAVTANTPAA